MNRTTVIYHSADLDGIFCREIARKFLGEIDVEYIGWNFGDPPLMAIQGDDGLGNVYIMDLPVDRPFGFDFSRLKRGEDWKMFLGEETTLTWIDHHKSSIESHPADILGYRIDGVAACRLAWQWFSFGINVDLKNSKVPWPSRQDFIDRIVSEPLAVRLAGEYDVWDKRDPDAETFQYGLRFVDQGADFWEALLSTDGVGEKAVEDLLGHGRIAQRYTQKVDASICNSLTWLMEWEGLNWLCVNHARFNSLFFAAKDIPETGHDALLGFRFDGKSWMVSLYHAKHRTDLDLSQIAVKYGGGGHRGACGFTCTKLPFLSL